MSKARAEQMVRGESVSRVTMQYANVLINYIIPAQLINPHALFITVKQILTVTMNEDNCETSHTLIFFFTLCCKVPKLLPCKATISLKRPSTEKLVKLIHVIIIPLS